MVTVDSRFQRSFKKNNFFLGRCPRLEMNSAFGAEAPARWGGIPDALHHVVGGRFGSQRQRRGIISAWGNAPGLNGENFSVALKARFTRERLSWR
jgi:hypothetical protein